MLLPTYMLRGICEGLCSADIVGFQTISDVRNFLDTCEELLEDVDVDHQTQVVTYQGRETSARAYPISINVEEIRRIASSPRALDYERRLLPMCAGKTIIRVEPGRTQQEHCTRVQGILSAPGPPSGAARRGHVPGLPGAITHPHQAVPALHGRDPEHDR